jgi:hypothetical protein
MTNDNRKVVTLDEALAKKKAAREEAHLRGFGGNGFPKSDKEMPQESAKRGLGNLARAAFGLDE